MSKQLSCGDLMPGCTTVIEGRDDEEVVAKAVEHARRDHQIEQITPELEAQVRGAIQEKP